MSYVRSLQELRKKLNVEEAPIQEEPRPHGGFASFRKASFDPRTTPNNELKYDPNKFVLEMMKKIKSSRVQFAEQVAKRADEDKTKKSVTAERTAQVYFPQVEEEIVENQPHAARAEAGGVPNMAGNTNIHEDVEFINGVKILASKYNTEPANILAAMHFETGGSFNPGIRNQAGSGATGLIQFMPSTAKNLGTTTDALASMSRTEQLSYVDQYFAGAGLSKNKSNDINDVYMAILWPKAVGQSDDYVLFSKGTKAYEQNKGLDIDGNGVVTKADASRKVRSFVEAYKNV